MKVCSHCKLNKKVAEFYVTKIKYSGGRAAWCKSCNSAYLKTYRIKNKDKINKRLREYHLKTKFNMSLNDYNNLYASQKGKCAVCDSPETRSFHIDHCHLTNKVRGLLCSKCNHMLGLSGDSIEVLNSAIKYLKKDKGD